MKIRPVLADTGRQFPGGSIVSLLNAGWSYTTAIPLPNGGWTLPQQALAVFAEASWDELNKLQALVIELLSDDAQPAYWAPGPSGGAPTARIQHQVVVGPVPGAPIGTPGVALVFMDMPAGSLWIPAPGHRYIWKINAGSQQEEIGFWVQMPQQTPAIGQSFPPGSPPPPNAAPGE